MCKHGVRKTYKLQYEPVRSEHATCDRYALFNHLSLPSASLKEVVDHFASRAEEVTLGLVEGNLQITSFTEGVVAKADSRQVLKQPVSTTVMMDAAELDEVDADEDVRITFGIREFRACCTLSEQLGCQLKIGYENAGRPLLVEFGTGGLTCELIVATTSDVPASHPMRSGKPGTARPPATLMGRKRPLTGTVASGRRTGYEQSSSASHMGMTSSANAQSQRPAWTATSQDAFQYAGAPEGSQPLFLPDEDATQGSTVGAQSRPVHRVEAQDEPGFGFNESGDEALEMYADELDAAEEEEAFSATQQPTQAPTRARGLFD